VVIESKEEAERYLRDRFEQTLPAQLDRYLQARVHEVIPHQFFSSASAECRQLFVAAHYYGCVSLAQSVAEGLCAFLARVNRQRILKHPKIRVERLATAGIISSASRDSFVTIWGDDRNDYHHLNPNVETDYARLQSRAASCIEALYVIEADVFAFDIQEGKITPRHRQYWPNVETGLTEVFLRFV